MASYWRNKYVKFEKYANEKINLLESENKQMDSKLATIEKEQWKKDAKIRTLENRVTELVIF